MVNKPAMSPDAVVFSLPIEYTELFATGVVVQEDESVATLVAGLYVEIVAC